MIRREFVAALAAFGTCSTIETAAETDGLRVVVDRVVDGFAVLLVESGDETLDQLDIPVEKCPRDMSEGDVFQIRFDPAQ